MNSLFRVVIAGSSKANPLHPLSSISLFSSTRNPPCQKKTPQPSQSPELPTPTATDVANESKSDELFYKPRPTEIPFQPKVANSVNLIGAVRSPVQFLASLDGKYWAGTVISQDQSKDQSITVPIIFEGDLAHTAACYLKEDDIVYVSGHLTADQLPLTLMGGQSNFQVVVHSLNFVQGFPSAKHRSSSHATKVDQLKQESMSNSTSLQQVFNLNSSGVKKKGLDNGSSTSSSWEEFLSDPTQWRDNRNEKLHNKVNPKYPDFKHKDGRGLWISSAPVWVLPKLEALGLNTPSESNQNSYKDGGRSLDESWKDVIDNPSRWWDNRVDKKWETSPDFRRKDTGEKLWLDRAPDWVLAKLPPPKPGKDG